MKKLLFSILFFTSCSPSLSDIRTAVAQGMALGIPEKVSNQIISTAISNYIASKKQPFEVVYRGFAYEETNIEVYKENEVTHTNIEVYPRGVVSRLYFCISNLQIIPVRIYFWERHTTSEDRANYNQEYKAFSRVYSYWGCSDVLVNPTNRAWDVSKYPKFYEHLSKLMALASNVTIEVVGVEND